MKKAKNQVIAGNYIGSHVCFGGLGFSTSQILVLRNEKGGEKHIDSRTVDSYDLITANNYEEKKFSFAKGLMGTLVLGPVGAVAGIGGSKQKSDIYTVAIFWKNEKKSLIEIDEPKYKLLIKTLF